MPTSKKKNKGAFSVDPQLYYIGRQFPGTATYAGTPGDAGVIVKLIGGKNDEKLIRLYGLSKWDGKKSFQCGKCGHKFINEYFRDAHGKNRHTPRLVPIRDLSELTAEQREIIKDEAGRADLNRRDPDYWVQGGSDFHVPDPEDRIFSQQERQLEQSIEWEKTAASRR